jgi:hypothetical protein
MIGRMAGAVAYGDAGAKDVMALKTIHREARSAILVLEKEGRGLLIFVIAGIVVLAAIVYAQYALRQLQQPGAGGAVIGGAPISLVPNAADQEGNSAS